MRYTRLIRTTASLSVAAGAVVLLTGGPARGDHHVDGPDDIGSDPRPTDPELTISDAEVVEGTGGTAELTFVLELDRPASGGEGVKFFTQDTVGSANPLEDHEPVLTYVTFPVGATDQAVAVPVVTDSVPEPDEQVMVGVSNPAGLTVADATSAGLIVDDDARRGIPSSGDGQTVVIGGGPALDPTGPPTALDAHLVSETTDQTPERSSALDIWVLAGVSALLVGIYLARTRIARRRM